MWALKHMLLIGQFSIVLGPPDMMRRLLAACFQYVHVREISRLMVALWGRRTPMRATATATASL